MKIGIYPGDAAWGMISNPNRHNGTDFALAQHNNGMTLLNAPSTQLLEFRKANVTCGGVNNSNQMFYSHGLVASDDRRKHNEVQFENALTTINKLTPKIYQKTLKLYEEEEVWNAETDPGLKECGLIAQDLLQIPELAWSVYDQDKAGTTNFGYAVDYSSINMYLLKAVQELSAKVDALEGRI